MPIALLMIVGEPQSVVVRYPDPAIIGAARLPVPNVVMTRAEADALSDAALAARLIGHIRHGPITEVTRQRSDPAPMHPSSNALKFVSFAEAGVPLRGRLCRGRDIQVTFDTIDGGREPDTMTLRGEDRPRRVFWVGQSATFGVMRKATPQACATMRLAREPIATADATATLLERLVAASEGERTGLTLGWCFDHYAPAAKRCNALATLKRLDWSGLGWIDRSDFTDEPVRWTFTIRQPDYPWR